ncbi:MAG: type II secretion system minor pseudopilin GspH [Magnetococcus sp. THC-1_WYH]
MKNGMQSGLPIANEQGFTLMELLVVFFIVALLSGLAVVSIRGNDPAAAVTTEALRIRELLDLAARESVFSFQETGVLFGSKGFSFLTQDETGQWSILKKDDVLRTRTLPEGMTFSVWTEEVPLALVDDEDLLDGSPGGKEIKPHLYFFSSGERIPFRIQIQTAQGIVRELTGGTVGAMTIESPKP